MATPTPLASSGAPGPRRRVVVIGAVLVLVVAALAGRALVRRHDDRLATRIERLDGMLAAERAENQVLRAQVDVLRARSSPTPRPSPSVTEEPEPRSTAGPSGAACAGVTQQRFSDILQRMTYAATRQPPDERAVDALIPELERVAGCLGFDLPPLDVFRELG